EEVTWIRYKIRQFPQGLLRRGVRRGVLDLVVVRGLCVRGLAVGGRRRVEPAGRERGGAVRERRHGGCARVGWVSAGVERPADGVRVRLVGARVQDGLGGGNWRLGAGHPSSVAWRGR